MNFNTSNTSHSNRTSEFCPSQVRKKVNCISLTHLHYGHRSRHSKAKKQVVINKVGNALGCNCGQKCAAMATIARRFPTYPYECTFLMVMMGGEASQQEDKVMDQSNWPFWKAVR